MSDKGGNAGDQSETDPEQEINFSFEGDVGDALGKGMDALKSVLGGFAGMVQDAIGPEGMRNLEASQWLTQVASCMEEVAAGLRDSGAVPAGKAGEVSCFLDRIEEETKGSKFESQLSSLRQKLEDASQTIQRASGSGSAAVSEQDISGLTDSAGYFNAAAASVALAGGIGGSDTPSSDD
ncbi:MAG: hypothetical protein GY903_14010 [Fuerstiella sp.]|nr:hypothetical protein [Fuerstiella sp.]MCP4855601.1 hypothetical protein [Fuerstiella sp.]